VSLKPLLFAQTAESQSLIRICHLFCELELAERCRRASKWRSFHHDMSIRRSFPTLKSFCSIGRIPGAEPTMTKQYPLIGRRQGRRHNHLAEPAESRLVGIDIMRKTQHPIPLPGHRQQGNGKLHTYPVERLCRGDHNKGRYAVRAKQIGARTIEIFDASLMAGKHV